MIDGVFFPLFRVRLTPCPSEVRSVSRPETSQDRGSTRRQRVRTSEDTGIEPRRVTRAVRVSGTSEGVNKNRTVREWEDETNSLPLDGRSTVERGRGRPRVLRGHPWERRGRGYQAEETPKEKDEDRERRGTAEVSKVRV